MTAGFGGEGFNIVTARVTAASDRHGGASGLPGADRAGQGVVPGVSCADNNVNHGPRVNLAQSLGAQAAGSGTTSLADNEGAAVSVAAEEGSVDAMAKARATAGSTAAAGALPERHGAAPGLLLGQVEGSAAASISSSAGSWSGWLDGRAPGLLGGS